MDWNLTDLTKLLGLSVAAFTVLRVAVGKPLVARVINPHRMTWVLAALGFFSGATGLLRWQTKSSDPVVWLAPLKDLVTDERADAYVMMAAFGMFNGLVILGLVGYCWLRLPRDPTTFRSLRDRAKVVRYYTRLRGGLDFATLIRLSKQPDATAEVLAFGVTPRTVTERLLDMTPARTLDAQVKMWTDLAIALHHEMGQLTKVLTAGGQGVTRRALFDVQFGGYLFQYIRPPEVGDDYVFVFAATLSQLELNSRRFEEHFELLVAALRNVKAGVEKF
jgi:hypothetical protein